MHCNEIISQTSLKSQKHPIYYVYLIRLFNKTSTSFLFLEFRYFELRNIYKRFSSPIRIQLFSSELVSSFIDSGADLYSSF